MKKLTEADRLAITKRLAAMDRGVIIGVREVAVLYNSTVPSVQQACSTKRLEKGGVNLKLPPRLQGLGRRVAWLHGDVRDALALCLPPAPTPVASPDSDPTKPADSAGAQGASSAATPGAPVPPAPKKTRMGRKRKA